MVMLVLSLAVRKADQMVVIMTDEMTTETHTSDFCVCVLVLFFG